MHISLKKYKRYKKINTYRKGKRFSFYICNKLNSNLKLIKNIKRNN